MLKLRNSFKKIKNNFNLNIIFDRIKISLFHLCIIIILNFLFNLLENDIKMIVLIFFILITI